MITGWFKMYRSITEWEWFTEHDMTCFFIYCLCKANRVDRYWRGTLVKKGQLVTSRSTMCRDVNIKPRRFRTIIDRLVNSGEIVVETSEKHTLITIVNWEKYQEDFMLEAEEESPTTDQRPTNDRPTTSTEIANTTQSESIVSDTSVQIITPKKDKSDANGDMSELLFGNEEPAPQPQPKKKKKVKKEDKEDQRVDCDFIMKLYNERCPHLPKAIKLNEWRKAKIRLRFAEMEYSYETLQEVFDKADASPFLRGENDRRWKCDLQWIINNSENWVRILEGRYDRKEPTPQPQNNQTNYGLTNAIVPTTPGRFVSTAERNAATSARQKYDILNTLAECQREAEGGNI